MSEVANLNHHEVGGDAGFSFDEIESITTHKEQVKEAEDGGAWNKVEQLEKKVEKLAKKEEPKQEAKAEEEKSAEASASGSEEKEEAKPLTQKEIKKILAKNGEESQELPSNLMFNHKVDGKEMEVSLQDLLNNFSGKESWDKRFQQLDVEKKAYQAERQMIEKYIDEFGAKVQNNDAMGAIEYLAQFAGVNPLEFRRMVRESLTPQVQKFMEMDESQRKLFTQGEELDFLKHQRESEIQKKAVEESHAALESQVVEFQKIRGMDEEALVKLHDDIKASFKGEVTLELMGQVLDMEARYNKAEGILNKVDKSLLEVDGNLELLVNVIKENPTFSDEDLAEIISEAMEKPLKQASKNVSKKAGNSKPENKKEEPAKGTKIDRLLLFDDL